jgi:hypothetical protein
VMVFQIIVSISTANLSVHFWDKVLPQSQMSWNWPSNLNSFPLLQVGDVPNWLILDLQHHKWVWNWNPHVEQESLLPSASNLLPHYSWKFSFANFAFEVSEGIRKKLSKLPQWNFGLHPFFETTKMNASTAAFTQTWTDKKVIFLSFLTQTNSTNAIYLFELKVHILTVHMFFLS